MSDDDPSPEQVRRALRIEAWAAGAAATGSAADDDLAAAARSDLLLWAAFDPAAEERRVRGLRTIRSARSRRRWVLAAAALIAVSTALAAVLAMPASPGAGGPPHWADGSRVVPDPGTVVESDPRERRVRLVSGRILVQVAAAAGAPFTVTAPHGTVVVTGTRFTVDAMADSTLVQVLEGRVELHSGTAAVPLSAGQSASMDGRGIGPVSPWRGSALPWPDRAPIGVFLLGLGNHLPPGNPNGWFEDATLDVRTVAGRAELRRRMLAAVDEAVASARQLGAQGVIWHNPEGSRWMNEAFGGYVGDPTLLPVLAPEMDAIADEVMARFRAAGLATGIQVRPWVLRHDPVGGLGAEEVPERMVEEASRRIDAAVRRWGSRIIVISHAYRGWSGRTLDADQWARLGARHPGILLIGASPTDPAARRWAAPFLDRIGPDPAAGLHPDLPPVAWWRPDTTPAALREFRRAEGVALVGLTDPGSFPDAEARVWLRAGPPPGTP